MKASTLVLLVAALGLALTVGLWGATPAQADGCTKSWAEAVDGLWTDASKWSPPGVPGPGDDVCLTELPSGDAYTVTLRSTTTVNSLSIFSAWGGDPPRGSWSSPYMDTT